MASIRILRQPKKRVVVQQISGNLPIGKGDKFTYMESWSLGSLVRIQGNLFVVLREPETPYNVYELVRVWAQSFLLEHTVVNFERITTKMK